MAGIKLGRVTDEISAMTRNAKVRAVTNGGSDADKDRKIKELRGMRGKVGVGSDIDKAAPSVKPQNAEPTKVNNRPSDRQFATEIDPDGGKYKGQE